MDYVSGNARELVNGALSPVTSGQVDARQYRRYQGTVIATIHIGERPVDGRKIIIYEVGCRDCDQKQVKPEATAIYRAKEFRSHIVGGTPYSNVYTTGIATLERLHSFEFKQAFTPGWTTFNFDGMVRSLAGFLAYCTWNRDGELSDMCAENTKPRLNGVVDCGQVRALSDNCVYIPSKPSSTERDNVFLAMMWAAVSVGSSVVTDYITTLKGAAAPTVDSLSGPDAWEGAVEALGVLATLYGDAGFGSCFALAFASGLHSVLSVVGQSDEGGVTRDIFRHISYGPSFGGIPPLTFRSGELAELGKYRHMNDLIAWVDGYALTTAAAVAHADPLSVINDELKFPTVLVSDAEDSADDEQHYLSLVAKFKSNYRLFSERYTRCLGLILGFKDQHGATEQKSRSVLLEKDYCATTLSFALSSTFKSGRNRHVVGRIMVPFFWIEPTTILPRRAFHTVAEDEGWASYGNGAEKTDLPYFEKVEEVSSSSDAESHWKVGYHGARKCGLFLFLNAHEDDGLKLIIPKQMCPDSIALTGLKSHDSVYDALQRGASVDEYLWTRGQSRLIHPAEFLNTDGIMGLAIQHMTIEFDELTRGRTEKRSWFKIVQNMPLRSEISGGSVQLTFSRALCLPPGAACVEKGEILSKRNAAVRALDRAVSLRGLYQGRPTIVFPVTTVAPRFGSQTGELSSVPSAEAVNSGRTTNPTELAQSSARRPVTGEDFLVRQTHEAVRGPVQTREAVIETRSFVTARPPPVIHVNEHSVQSQRPVEREARSVSRHGSPGRSTPARAPQGQVSETGVPSHNYNLRSSTAVTPGSDFQDAVSNATPQRATGQIHAPNAEPPSGTAPSAQ